MINKLRNINTLLTSVICYAVLLRTNPSLLRGLIPGKALHTVE